MVQMGSKMLCVFLLLTSKFGTSDCQEYRQMVMDIPGENLYVAGQNALYQFNTTDLEQEITSFVIGPDNVTDVEIFLMVIAVGTASSGSSLTFCVNLDYQCFAVSPNDINDMVENGTKISSENAFAMFVEKPNDKYYWFVACPYQMVYQEDESICSKPGIYGTEKLKDGYNQHLSVKLKKDVVDESVKTEKYLAGFSFNDSKIFFSIQGQTLKTSRVSHLCQIKKEMKKTYIDMPIKCGTDNILTDVKVESKLFVATFTNQHKMGTSVCVYSLDDVKTRLADNKKKCYKAEYRYGSVTETDYIGERPRCSNRPSNDSLNFLLNESQHMILCSVYDIYFGVIGDLILETEPVLRFEDRVISEITLSEKEDGIIAFFGSERQISKAVIYPRTKTARKLKTDYTVHETLQKGLLNDGTSLFALTKSEIYKFPMANCSTKITCDQCLEDKDPDCGWCIMGNMCTTSSDCMDEHIWLPPKSVSECPKISQILPDIINVKDPRQNLSIQITPDIDFSNYQMTCDYIINSNTITEPAIHNVGGQDTGVICLEPYQEVKDLMDETKGTLVVNVSVKADTSAISLVSSKITYYKCDAFSKCMDCVHTNWSCVWCPYANRCLDNGIDCSTTPNTTVTSVKKCATSTSFSVNQELLDDNGTLIITKDEYSILIGGVNFPQPNNDLQYTCVIMIQDSMSVPGIYINASAVECNMTLSSKTLQNGTLPTELSLKFGEMNLDGITQAVLFYDCASLITPLENCGECKSFKYYKPHYRCHWCGDRCLYEGEVCPNPARENSQCPNPTVKKVWPMSAFVNSTLQVDISGFNLGSKYNETVNSVAIAGLPCRSIEELYIPSKRISCLVGPSMEAKSGQIQITGEDTEVVQLPDTFSFRVPQISSVCPEFGPRSGGTNLTIGGVDLNTGRSQKVYLSGVLCKRTTTHCNPDCLKSSKGQEFLCCTTGPTTEDVVNVAHNVDLQFDGESITAEDVKYEYTPDAIIESINPKESFMAGGRTLTITGQNLLAIQKPKIYLKHGNNEEVYACSRKNVSVNQPGEQRIYCPSPEFKPHRLEKRDLNMPKTILAFEMDGVKSVANLPKGIAALSYHSNPVIKEFKNPEPYQKIIIIEGKNLDAAASLEDVTVWISSIRKCNVTLFESEKIYCNPPPQSEVLLNMTRCPGECFFTVEVHIGFIRKHVGYIKYGITDEPDSKETIWAGVAGGICAVIVIALIIAVTVLLKKRKTMHKEKKGLEYMMEKKEAKFREQCRKEFAGLQTAMSDLTSDLSGGNVLFRDYNVYASHVIFTYDRDHVIMRPPQVTTEYSTQAMDTFKGLLRNTQFLLVLVRTLDKQKQFTIQDKSSAASILMTLSHDNMEYITEIMKTLLSDLVDKNVAANTQKLLLRRSECVAEKLLTHWLSICLYHYLKERAGSPLFILYKAIKIQVERGPVDYISNCAKFTLSEDKLLAEDINLKSLTLQVTHEDYFDDEEKMISVIVLGCDTITQIKSKMLEVFYKNVGYSQRPSVHSTHIEWLQEDGTSRVLSDEDPLSLKEGIWKRINTLEYYGVEDGAKMYLAHSRKEQVNISGNPDAYIGSFKRSKQIVRTISGSNFWHLTKHYQGDNDEVKIASDILLPRLLVTKGTLQSYVDDLLKEILCVTGDPPIIIKYLFDFLDTAAEDRGITDPDVLHTWKCNSLLLRFWVNIMKNPEFVFDIFKPHNVDKCLSVVAQAFMDSCSTVDVCLGMGSPSNKLLFARDIPRYKTMVTDYFKYIQNKPAVSDQDLNSYLTEKVSMKFSGSFHQSSALMEMYKYASAYRHAILSELDNLEAGSPGHYSPLTSKLQLVYMMMDREGSKS